jgi:hypothetical protein
MPQTGPSGRTGRWRTTRSSWAKFGPAVCIAIAVLKYRLYAIDRIISRVVSYRDHHRRARRDICRAFVLFATSVLPVKAPVAVALRRHAAALFNRAAAAVQRAVYRRFNRTRYNVERRS